MRLRGEKYSFVGTAIAIIMIILFVILQKYVFKADEKPKEAALPTEGTLALSTVDAEFSAGD